MYCNNIFRAINAFGQNKFDEAEEVVVNLKPKVIYFLTEIAIHSALPAIQNNFKKIYDLSSKPLKLTGLKLIKTEVVLNMW